MGFGCGNEICNILGGKNGRENRFKFTVQTRILEEDKLKLNNYKRNEQWVVKEKDEIS